MSTIAASPGGVQQPALDYSGHCREPLTAAWTSVKFCRWIGITAIGTFLFIRLQNELEAEPITGHVTYTAFSLISRRPYGLVAPHALQSVAYESAIALTSPPAQNAFPPEAFKMTNRGLSVRPK